MSDLNDECIHGLGLVAACTVCNGRDARERAQRDEIVARFPARYISLLGCGHFSEIGEQLTRTADDRLLCEECAP